MTQIEIPLPAGHVLCPGCNGTGGYWWNKQWEPCHDCDNAGSLALTSLVPLTCGQCQKASKVPWRYCGPRHRMDWGGMRYLACPFCATWNQQSGLRQEDLRPIGSRPTRGSSVSYGPRQVIPIATIAPIPQGPKTLMDPTARLPEFVSVLFDYKECLFRHERLSAQHWFE